MTMCRTSGTTGTRTDSINHTTPGAAAPGCSLETDSLRARPGQARPNGHSTRQTDDILVHFAHSVSCISNRKAKYLGLNTHKITDSMPKASNRLFDRRVRTWHVMEIMPYQQVFPLAGVIIFSITYLLPSCRCMSNRKLFQKNKPVPM